LLNPITSVEPRPDYRLWVRFADGVEGEVSLEPLVGKGVFELWTDREIFRAVTVDPESGTVVWPGGIDLAPDRRARIPTLPWPPFRVVRFGGTALSAGVEIHTLEGIPVQVYGIAKTIADLFKYRNKIGLDVALEALKEVWSDGRVQMDELIGFARICRVDRVIRPYLEAVTS